MEVTQCRKQGVTRVTSGIPAARDTWIALRMKRAVQLVVLVLASLLTLQQAMGEQECIPAACAQSHCGAGCCMQMSGMNMAAGVASHRVANPRALFEAACGEQGCRVSVARRAILRMEPTLGQNALAAQATDTVAVRAQRVGMSGRPARRDVRTPKNERYLCLRVFRI